MHSETHALLYGTNPLNRQKLDSKKLLGTSSPSLPLPPKVVFPAACPPVPSVTPGGGSGGRSGHSGRRDRPPRGTHTGYQAVGWRRVPVAALPGLAAFVPSSATCSRNRVRTSGFAERPVTASQPEADGGRGT